jgi:DNA replication protein DnaC
MLSQTKNMMSELKLSGLLKTVDLRLQEALQQNWGHIDLLSSLIMDEKMYRDNLAIQKRLKNASFRTNACFENLDYTAKRNISKSLVKDLMQLEFIKQSPRNIIIVGPTGVGKTFLATALGHHACRHGYSSLFYGITVLSEKLMMSRANGTYLRFREKLIRADLLIIDDIGLKKLIPEIHQDFHDILEERQMKCTLITTQLPLKNWGEIIEDPLALDTIVDKLHHGSLLIDFDGDSYRKKKSQNKKIDIHNVPEEIAKN